MGFEVIDVSYSLGLPYSLALPGHVLLFGRYIFGLGGFLEYLKMSGILIFFLLKNIC